MGHHVPDLDLAVLRRHAALLETHTLAVTIGSHNQHTTQYVGRVSRYYNTFPSNFHLFLDLKHYNYRPLRTCTLVTMARPPASTTHTPRSEAGTNSCVTSRGRLQARSSQDPPPSPPPSRRHGRDSTSRASRASSASSSRLPSQDVNEIAWDKMFEKNAFNGIIGITAKYY